MPLTKPLEIKRAVEIWLCSLLNAVDVNVTFYPAKGDEQKEITPGDESLIEPPYGVVTINESEEIITGANIFRLKGSAIIMTHQDDTDPDLHAVWVAATKQVLDEIQVSTLGGKMIKPSGFNFIFHGIDIHTTMNKDVDEDKAHADAWVFTAGATYFNQLTP